MIVMNKSQLSNKFRLSLAKINKLISLNLIKYDEEKKEISEDSYQRLCFLTENYINLKEYVDGLKLKDSLFDSSRKSHRDAFVAHLHNNNDDFILCNNDDFAKVLFNNMPAINRNEITADIHRKNILWLRGFKKDAGKKLSLLKEFVKNMQPELIKAFNNFPFGTESQRLSLFSAIIFITQKDLENWGKKEINEITKELLDYPKITQKLFFEFQQQIIFKGFLKQDVLLKINKPTLPKDNEPYSFEQMAYIYGEVFLSTNLYEKAFTSSKDAQIWFFVAMHFFCGARGGDIKRLPTIEFNYSIDFIKEKIVNKDGMFFEDLAIKYQFLVNRLYLKPQKTKQIAPYVNRMYVSFPESAKERMGEIIAILLLHNREGRKEMVEYKRFSFLDYKRFFGANFVEKLGNRAFISVKANKCFLNGIYNITEENHDQFPIGYHLASLYRSHRERLGELSPTTSIYLSLTDKERSVSKDEIIKQLFERGTLSFIVLFMLKKAYPDSFLNLSFSDTTKMLQIADVSADNILDIVQTIKQENGAIENLIEEILHNDKERYKEALVNIASGRIISKTDGISCILYTINGKCAFLNRKTCIGCPYEIISKDVLHILIKEKESIKMDNSNSFEFFKSKRMNDFLKGKVIEYVLTLKEINPNIDFNSYLETVKEAIEDNGKSISNSTK